MPVFFLFFFCQCGFMKVWHKFEANYSPTHIDKCSSNFEAFVKFFKHRTCCALWYCSECKPFYQYWRCDYSSLLVPFCSLERASIILLAEVIHLGKFAVRWKLLYEQKRQIFYIIPNKAEAILTKSLEFIIF